MGFAVDAINGAMNSSTKRPISIWVLLVLLLVIGLGGGYELYDRASLLRYYGIGYEVILVRYEVWTSLFSLVAAPAAFVLVWRRQKVGRLVAVAVVAVSLVLGVLQSWQIMKRPKDEIDIAVEIFSYLVAFLPLAYLCVHVFISRKARGYFGDEVVGAGNAEPPPPPTFEAERNS